ncbi:MAG: divalent-cation tolerance protein CutA [Steroidobacteraceae bacterium]
MASAVLIAFCTCPDTESAGRLTTAVVTEGLAACVNQLPGVQSTYMWQGRLHHDSEVLLLIKTTADQLATLAARIKALHPYELPEFIAVPVCAGSESYLDWIRQNTASKY